MAQEQVQDLQELPSPASTRLIDFTEVEILTLKSFPPQYILVVSGTKPYLNMDVSLVPLTYVRRPEYWGIEVIGSVSAIGVPALAPYTGCLQLNELRTTGFIGTCGIEVIGASRSERDDVSIEGVGPGKLPTELFERWTQSFEESTDEAEVYRRRGFQFPPAFARRGLEIREDGDFILHAVGPADGTIAVPGYWIAAGSDKISVCLEGRAPVTLTILSVDDDVLRLKRGSGSDL